MDKDNAHAFYENMRTKRDYAVEFSTGNLDKTEKLLGIDFLLGGPGTTHELINKLCVDQNCSLSKEGFFRILGEVLAASPVNIKKDITRGIKEIRSGNNLSPKRIDQLRNVKAVFTQSKLALKASGIDRLIDSPERRTIGLKNGIKYR